MTALRRTAALGLALVLGAGVAGCGEDEPTLTVLAAASLTEPFSTLVDAFEVEHPGVRVSLVFESSATLAQMAVERAPGDVLATADQRTMDRAESQGGTSAGATRFASNVLVLAVPATNPAGIETLGDLDRPGVDYLTCVTTAPCGAAARDLLSAAGITRSPASQEVDVRAVLGKVMTGEADAGLVYRTDVISAADQVQGFAIPGADERPNTYWVAPTANVADADLAQAWIDLLTGPQGRSVLARAGFVVDGS